MKSTNLEKYVYRYLAEYVEDINLFSIVAVTIHLNLIESQVYSRQNK